MTDNSSNNKIVISFSDDYPIESFKLIELNNEILEDLNLNKKLYIKGVDKNEEAVLCTSNKTYILKSAHTSNSMMLTKDYSIISLQQLHYEATEIPPRLSNLKAILLKRAIDSDDYNIDSIGYTLNELEPLVQSSLSELNHYLNNVLYVYYLNNEKVTLLTDKYHTKILDLILTEITINGWSSQSIPMEECISKIEIKSKHLVGYIFKIYTIRWDDGFYKLRNDLICIFRGKQILQNENKAIEMTKFMESWIDSLPVGFTPKFDLLIGLAISITKNGKQFAHYYNHEELTIVPKERISNMFKLNPKWSLVEMEPYIIPILPSNEKSLESFILKFARATTTPGTKEKVFISRY